MFRQQTGAPVEDFAQAADSKAKKLENIVTTHTDAMNQAVAKMEVRLDVTDSISDRIERLLEIGALEWQKARSDFEAERNNLEKTRKEMEKHLHRREWLWFILILAGLIGIGIAIGIRFSR